MWVPQHQPHIVVLTPVLLTTCLDSWTGDQ